MKRLLAEAAAGRIRSSDSVAEPMTEAEVLGVLARIARTGKPGDRLRAVELIGRHMGMFREKTPDPGTSFADLILAASRKRELRAVDVVIDVPRNDA
jgi:hypothetical protein